MAEFPISKLTTGEPLDGNEALIVSQLSATVTITAATISADASDNSYNDSGNGFLAAGFALGDHVNVDGFTGDVANNIFSGLITDITAGKITIGGTDGDVIVNDAPGEAVTITKWESHRITAQEIADLVPAPPAPTECFLIAVGDETTAATAGAGKVTFRMPYAFTVTEVRASLNVAAASGAFTVDINEGGVSILSTKLTFDATETTTVAATTPPVISDPDIADDAEITIDIDSIGGGGGAGLKVYIIGHQ